MSSHAPNSGAIKHRQLHPLLHCSNPCLVIRLPPLSADEKPKYLTLLLCGAFTSRQLTLASKSLGFVPDSVPAPHSQSARDARSCFVRLWLLCLDGIQTFFYAHKEQQR